MNKFLSIILLFILFLSCNSDNSYDTQNLLIEDSTTVTISINNPKDYLTLDADKIFNKNLLVVRLESKEESLLGGINRLSFYKDEIYILDKKLGSVLKFDKNGKFLYKYSHIGGGPGEYMALTDFTINSKSNTLVLYSDRPKKIINYNLENDKFLSESSVKELYESISSFSFSESQYLVGFTRLDIYKYYFKLYNFNNGFEKPLEYFPINETSIETSFLNFKTEYPTLILSKSLYSCIPYVNIVNEFKSSQPIKKFKLSFDREVKDLNKNELNAEEIINTTIQENLGFWFSNFREYENKVSFSFGRGTKVIYDFINKDYKIFDFIHNELYDYNHFSHFAHDFFDTSNSVDNTFIFIEQPFKLISYYENMKEIRADDWKKLDTNIKNQINSLNENENPILFIYNLK